MKILQRFILVIGIVTVAVLFWKLDAGSVWAQVASVGYGFIAVIALQFCDQIINALAFRYSFSKEHSRAIPFIALLNARIAGDGVNYLVPSGNLAGEFVRPALLGTEIPPDIRNAGVLTAKCAQALSQALFVVLGLLLFLHGQDDFLGPRQKYGTYSAGLLVIVVIGYFLYVMTLKRPPSFLNKIKLFENLQTNVRLYLRAHPFRFVASTILFIAGFAWGAVEVKLVCAILDIPMPWVTAIVIEILSCAIDSLFFMVPGKIGTQEAGKTAIFHGLGYAASTGLAFGIIRHIREIVWAVAGFILYVLQRNKMNSNEKTSDAIPSIKSPAQKPNS